MPDGGAIQAKQIVQPCRGTETPATSSSRPCATFVGVVLRGRRRRADQGRRADRDTACGSVHENYDLLSAHALHVVAENELRIRTA